MRYRLAWNNGKSARNNCGVASGAWREPPIASSDGTSEECSSFVAYSNNAALAGPALFGGVRLPNLDMYNSREASWPLQKARRPLPKEPQWQGSIDSTLFAL